MHLHGLFGCHLLQEVSLKDPVPGETSPPPAAQGCQASSPPWGHFSVPWYIKQAQCPAPHHSANEGGRGAPKALDVSEEPEEREAARRFPPCLECSQALFQASQVVSWAVVTSLLCPIRPPPTCTSTLVLPATRRPSQAPDEARLNRRAGALGIGQAQVLSVPAVSCLPGGVGSWSHPGASRAARAPGDQIHGRGSDRRSTRDGPEGTDPAQGSTGSAEPPCVAGHRAGRGAPSPGAPAPREPQKSFRTIPLRIHSQSDVFNETPVDEPVGLGRECHQGS